MEEVFGKVKQTIDTLTHEINDVMAKTIKVVDIVEHSSKKISEVMIVPNDGVNQKNVLIVQSEKQITSESCSNDEMKAKSKANDKLVEEKIVEILQQKVADLVKTTLAEFKEASPSVENNNNSHVVKMTQLD